jgi:hypothetical protein
VPVKPRRRFWIPMGIFDLKSSHICVCCMHGYENHID